MNKRTAFLLIAIGVSGSVAAQDEGDALRYSRLTTGGTARTQAIGGAAGSLGGDLTATHVNPAGLGFFKTSEVNVSPGFYFRSNSYNYLGTATSADKSGARLNNVGIVFGIPTRRKPNSPWKNFAFALDYNRLADFNNKTSIAGVNTGTSYSDKWVESLNAGGAVPTGDASAQFPLGASLGYNTYLLNVDLDPDGNPTNYYTVVNPTNPGGIYQQDMVKEKGGLDEFSLGFGGNYNEQLFIGVSVNFPTIHYERSRTFAEDDESGDGDNDFSFFEHTENLTTDAVGFNSKLGLIYAPMPNLRLGVAYHTPTWYNMRDASTAYLAVNTENLPIGDPPVTPAPTDGTDVQRFQGTEELTDGFPVEYEYSLRTPSRALASVSYIFGTNADVKQQHGFLTADVEYVNYGGTKFKYNKGLAEDEAIAHQLNNVVENAYKGAVNLRLGGEMKFNVFAVRAGFAYYGNPYNSDYADVDASMKKISGGVGYRNRGFFADLTYVHTLANDLYTPYTLSASPVPVSSASADISGGNVVLTVGLKF